LKREKDRKIGGEDSTLHQGTPVPFEAQDANKSINAHGAKMRPK